MTKAPLKTLYLLHGNDEFTVDEKARALVDNLCPPADRALGLEIIDGKADNADQAVEAIKACMEALRTPGFLAATKVVWLKQATFLDAGRTAKAELTKTWLGHLTDLLKSGLTDGVVFVVQSGKIDARTALAKLFKDKGAVQEYSVTEKSWQAARETRAYVQAWFKEAGRKIEPRALDRLVDRVGADRRRLAGEAEKLCLYATGEPVLTEAHVLDIVSPGREALVWDLTEALGQRHPGLSLRVLEDLQAQGESAMAAVIFMERTVAQLLVLRACLDQGWVRLRRSGPRIEADWSLPPEGEELLAPPFPDPRKMHPFRVAKTLEQAERFKTRELSAWQTRILKAHEKMVTSAVPHFLVLQQLVFELMPLRRAG